MKEENTCHFIVLSNTEVQNKMKLFVYSKKQSGSREKKEAISSCGFCFDIEMGGKTNAKNGITLKIAVTYTEKYYVFLVK